MSGSEEDNTSYNRDGKECVNVEMYQTGEGGFHVFNLAPNHYHRQEALERTGAVEITGYLDKVIHGTISPTEYGSIIVMQWYFQPSRGRRISEATISLLFEPQSSDSDTELEVRDISFEGTYGLMTTSQETATTRGLEATAGVQQVAQANLTAKWESTITTTTSDSITLMGGKRMVNNTPPKRIAEWELQENQSQPRGIPGMLRIAVLVARDDEEKFQCRVNFTCKTDLKTKLAGMFQRIPKDDPIIFQPDSSDKGRRENKGVDYGVKDLGNLSLDDLSDVTYKRVISNGEKAWK
ncbi:intracellular serine protease [Fusarium globosum]|uniref:Intracellular serine protease n=1 Tax=Fusarium globosum TaxID=78864 RepID=A0A8H6D9A3_9HYPO|nr:intracellular serine protease [Fusarium globosum]